MASFLQTRLERVEFRDLRIKEAPLVVDDWTFCMRLGFSGKALWYILNNRHKLYQVIKIKKASGGLRTIHNPNRIIKLFLTLLRVRILLPLTTRLGPHVSAYQIGKKTVDAAAMHLHPCATCAPADQPHTCKEYVVEKVKGKGFRVVRSDQGTCLACQPIPKHACSRRGVKIHMDLKDFFGSTRRAWIRKYFHEVVGYNNYASNLLATCMTVEFTSKKGAKYQAVPQGAPTSGDICNLVADVRLDQPLMKALEGSGWVYTRYSDDLYFSHPQNLSKDAVTQMITQVDNFIRASGYRMNRKKLQIQRPKHRQQLLGVVLNQKINFSQEKYRRMHAILNNCYRHGFKSQMERAGFDKEAKFVSYLSGQLAYLGMLNARKANRLKQIFELAKSTHGLNKEAEVTFRNGVRVA